MKKLHRKRIIVTLLTVIAISCFVAFAGTSSAQDQFGFEIDSSSLTNLAMNGYQGTRTVDGRKYYYLNNESGDVNFYAGKTRVEDCVDLETLYGIDKYGVAEGKIYAAEVYVYLVHTGSLHDIQLRLYGYQVDTAYDGFRQKAKFCFGSDWGDNMGRLTEGKLLKLTLPLNLADYEYDGMWANEGDTVYNKLGSYKIYTYNTSSTKLLISDLSVVETDKTSITIEELETVVDLDKPVISVPLFENGEPNSPVNLKPDITESSSYNGTLVIKKGDVVVDTLDFSDENVNEILVKSFSESGTFSLEYSVTDAVGNDNTASGSIVISGKPSIVIGDMALMTGERNIMPTIEYYQGEESDYITRLSVTGPDGFTDYYVTVENDEDYTVNFDVEGTYIATYEVSLIADESFSTTKQITIKVYDKAGLNVNGGFYSNSQGVVSFGRNSDYYDTYYTIVNNTSGTLAYNYNNEFGVDVSKMACEKNAAIVFYVYFENFTGKYGGDWADAQFQISSNNVASTDWQPRATWALNGSRELPVNRLSRVVLKISDANYEWGGSSANIWNSVKTVRMYVADAVGEFAVSNVNMVITDEATGVYPTEVSEMTFNVPSINLIDSVYQGEYESFEGASDNRAVIVFATISFKDYELAELGECGLIIRWTDSDGQHEKNFVALNTAQNGNFGIALYNMPGGNYEVQGYISDGSILSNVINITVS